MTTTTADIGNIEGITVITCEKCGKTEPIPNDILWAKVCGGCYPQVRRQKQNKECRICGELRVPKNSKEEHCEDCKALITGGKGKDALPETPTVQPPNEINLGKVTTTLGNSWNLVGYQASKVKPENVMWLWPGRVPLSKATLFAGRPGGGKSMVAIDVAARVSTGADFPDGEKNTLGPKQVLYLATEDGVADTLVPRFMAAGADMTKVFFPRCVLKTDAKTNKQERAAISLKAHISLLEASLKQHPKIGLVVLDPLTSFIGVNINKDEESRAMMDKLVAVFDNSGATFIAIIHHNKRSDVSALEQILGSSSIVGAARAVWDFSRDPDNKEERHMSLVKLNIGKEPGGMKYSVTTKQMGDISGACVEWGEQTTESADDLIARRRDKAKEGVGGDKKRDKAMDLILDMVPCWARDAYKKAEEEGISGDTMKRAYRSLGIKPMQLSGGWWWQLPGQSDSDAAKLPDQDVM
jgi:putative DNA primase/helicase